MVSSNTLITATVYRIPATYITIMYNVDLQAVNDAYYPISPDHHNSLNDLSESVIPRIALYLKVL